MTRIKNKPKRSQNTDLILRTRIRWIKKHQTLTDRDLRKMNSLILELDKKIFTLTEANSTNTDLIYFAEN